MNFKDKKTIMLWAMCIHSELLFWTSKYCLTMTTTLWYFELFFWGYSAKVLETLILLLFYLFFMCFLLLLKETIYPKHFYCCCSWIIFFQINLSFFWLAFNFQSSFIFILPFLCYFFVIKMEIFLRFGRCDAWVCVFAVVI